MDAVDLPDRDRAQPRLPRQMYCSTLSVSPLCLSCCGTLEQLNAVSASGQTEGVKHSR